VSIKQVGWEKRGTELAENYTFFYEEGNEDHQLGRGFLLDKVISSAVRKFAFINNRISYIILRGRWCNIIVFNVHNVCENESEDIQDSFCEEVGNVCDQFRSYDMKIYLVNFIANVGR
jgi:alpha-glucuronidase